MQRSFINLQSKVENQVRKITHIGTKVVQLEAEKAKELQHLHNRWVEKCEVRITYLADVNRIKKNMYFKKIRNVMSLIYLCNFNPYLY